MNGFDFYTVARFWSKVTVGHPNECWTWTAGTNADAGYGRFRVKGRLELPHRLAYTMANGEIPQGKGYHGTVIMHRCDNPSCVNPAHLCPGSQRENILDMVDKDRMQFKSKKLTQEQILAIATDPRPIRQCAKEYGISRTHVSRIRKRFRDIPDVPPLSSGGG